MKKRYGLVLIACAMILAFVSGCGKKQQEAEPDKLRQEAETEKSQPETEEVQQDVGSTSHLDGEEQSADVSFEGLDMEGNSVTEAVLSQSNLTMINVWATYCNPCLREMPDLGELAGAYNAEDFQIIGIVSDVMEGADATAVEYAESLIEQTGADYTHLLLNRSIYEAFLRDVSAVPTTFFVDENGVVLDMVVGAMEKSAWEEKINALMER